MSIPKEALLLTYQQKWRAILLSTQRINCQKAADAIKAIYAAMEESEPQIHFFDSPFAAMRSPFYKQICEGVRQYKQRLTLTARGLLILFVGIVVVWFLLLPKYPILAVSLLFLIGLVDAIAKQFPTISVRLTDILYCPLAWVCLPSYDLRAFDLIHNLKNQVKQYLRPPVLKWLWPAQQLNQQTDPCTQLYRQVESQLIPLLGKPRGVLAPELYYEDVSKLDFCISVLNCSHNHRIWTAGFFWVKKFAWYAIALFN
ncbi:MAG: hypothetical protein N2235_22350 [Fischerella sp.]|nr:hypothetical protein [Fischerella sp.]